MKRGWIWVALLLSVGINIGVLATIGASRVRREARSERPRDPGGSPPFERMANHLQLEGGEREEFIEIQQRLFRAVRQHQVSLHELRGELRREVMGETPEPAKVDGLLAEIGDTHMDLDRLMVESVLASRQILTPKQQKRYFQILERIQEATRRSGPRGGRHHGRPARRPPPPDKP